MNSPKPLQIFKPGRHTAMSGAVLEFSAADLAACAAAYDPAKHEAPIVVGHPKTDGPAYGWVAGLVSGNGLEAIPHQVDPAFAGLVAAGRFKKISASFFAPNSPANPVPGVYYLRHVGFLGAQPPAVKGLRQPEFAGGEGVIEFADVSDVMAAGLWRRLRDFFIAQFGLEKADSVIPDYAVASLESEARAESDDEPAAGGDTAAPAAFSETHLQGDPMSAEDKARLDALEAENKRLKEEAAARARAARHADNAAFAESLVRDGRLPPGHQAMVVAFMDALPDDGSVIEFAEAGAEGGTKKCAPLAAFREFLSAQPKQVEFGEVSADTSAAAGGTVAFAAPLGFSVDPAGLALHRKAQAHAAAHKVSYDEALKAVS